MAWIKRNLYFVITVAVALGVTGYCGYLLYAALNENAAASEKYASSKSSLDDLLHKSPFPSPENIKAAESDAGRVKTFLAEFRKPFAPFPTPPTLNAQEFNTYLTKTIALFGAEATNAGVGLDPGYAFAFSQQVGKLNHPLDSIAPWLQEMEEIRAILHILYKAKINYLEKIHRVSVSSDDGGIGDDYIQFTNSTTAWGSVSPYMINFRAFSAEIANVLAGIASSSNCFIVKAIYVSPSRVPLPEPPAQQTAPAPTMREYFRPPPSEFNPSPGRRGGRDYEDYNRQRRMVQPQQPQPQAAAPVVAAPPETIEFEKPLFVTLYIDVVKLKPPPAEKPAEKPAASPRPGRRGAP
jgi:hypothetical protein